MSRMIYGEHRLFCDPADSKDLPAAMKFREWRFNRLAIVQPSSKLHRGMFHISTKKTIKTCDIFLV